MAFQRDSVSHTLNNTMQKYTENIKKINTMNSFIYITTVILYGYLNRQQLNIIFIVFILLCVINIWLGNVSINTARKMVSQLKSLSHRLNLLFKATCFGPHGTILRQCI
jgi:hypothetical protein